MDIIKVLSQELNIKAWQTEAAIKLIDEGNTIPFIARYRKEATGALNDEVLRTFHERLMYLRNLEEKKLQVISSIEEQGKMTEELKKAIETAVTMVAVEDLYRPYRPKRRTRAIIAKEKGLEPLAHLIYLQETSKSLMEEVKKLFRPEFLNRIDDTIVFHSLNEEHMKKIVGLMCNELVERVKAQLNIKLTIRDSVKKFIVEKGTDKKYGARPLRRALQNELEDKLAEAILAGEVEAGSAVEVGVSKGELKFRTESTNT